MRKITTEDGSEVFYSDEYQEAYKTKSGAVEEAFRKFVEPCRIAELAKKGKVRILDVCFGLGYNSAAAIDAAMETNGNAEIDIVGLENDERVFGMIKELSPELKCYSLLKKLDASNLKLQAPNINLKIILGDARETIKQLNGKFDAVFLDPFSPKKCPALWTDEFIAEISGLMEKGAVVATYSYARAVRDSLKKAGLDVRDGPIVGRRSPSTYAIK